MLPTHRARGVEAPERQLKAFSRRPIFFKYTRGIPQFVYFPKSFMKILFHRTFRLFFDMKILFHRTFRLFSTYVRSFYAPLDTFSPTFFDMGRLVLRLSRFLRIPLPSAHAPPVRTCTTMYLYVFHARFDWLVLSLSRYLRRPSVNAPPVRTSVTTCTSSCTHLHNYLYVYVSYQVVTVPTCTYAMLDSTLTYFLLERVVMVRQNKGRLALQG